MPIETDYMNRCMVCGNPTDNPDNICMNCQEENNIWSTHRYHLYCEQVKKDLQADGLYNDEGAVMEAAKNILDSNRELKTFIEFELGASNPVERFASDI